MPEHLSPKELLKRAYAHGELSHEGAMALVRTEVQDQLVKALNPDLPPGHDLLMITVLVDDSTSISYNSLQHGIADGHNHLLKVLREQKTGTPTMVMTRLLSGRLVNMYSLPSGARLLDLENYNPSRFIDSTPLFLQSVITLGNVMTQLHLAEVAGRLVRSVVLIMSDGQNNHASTLTEADVAWLVRDLQITGKHLVAGYAVGKQTGDVVEVFKRMGIEPKWILDTPDALEALLAFTRTVVRATLSKESFDQLLLGRGFE